jgi:hypothetical protein
VTWPTRATTRRQARGAGWLAPPVAVQVAPSQRHEAPSMITVAAGALEASARVRLVAGASARAGAAANRAAAMQNSAHEKISGNGSERQDCAPEIANVSFNRKLSSAK